MIAPVLWGLFSPPSMPDPLSPVLSSSSFSSSSSVSQRACSEVDKRKYRWLCCVWFAVVSLVSVRLCSGRFVFAQALSYLCSLLLDYLAISTRLREEQERKARLAKISLLMVHQRTLIQGQNHVDTRLISAVQNASSSCTKITRTLYKKEDAHWSSTCTSLICVTVIYILQSKGVQCWC